ncbi:MAG: hypothetical protein WA960_23040, partial [Tunicatimonas sp.]
PDTYQPGTLREQILRSVNFLSYVRWHNYQQVGQLNFKGLGLGKFFNTTNLSIQVEVCIQEIHTRSPEKRINIEIDLIQNLQTNNRDLLQLSNGHDVEKALALFVTSQSSQGVSEKEIGKALRLSYTKEEFQKTKLFEALQKWEVASNYALFS